MAESIFDACACAGKSVSTFFNTIDPTGSGLDAPGLIKHWAVTYDVQVRVFCVVLDTGSASIEELIDALPGHPAPVEAVMAMVEAGLLVRELGPVTPHTRVSMPAGGSANGAGPGNSPADTRPGSTTARGSNIVELRSSVSHIRAIGFVPELFIVDVADRIDLPPQIDGPVVYCALDGERAYTGKSGRGRHRVLGAHLRGFKRLAVIRDATGLMTESQAGIAERILYLTLFGALGYKANQEIPYGERGEFSEYLQIRLFVAQALCLAKEAGFGFSDVQVLQLIVGAEGDPKRMAVEDLSQADGVAYHLYAAGINARATEQGGEWVIHPGSEVRSRITRSGSSVVNSLRHEWLFSGVLVEDEGRFRLTEPVAFSSGSGAANFLLGSKGPNLAAWTLSEDRDADRLSPTA